jgi:chromatin segregation and condensation protein Rec8/ScpA/Scc1 (kleisin family)
MHHAAGGGTETALKRRSAWTSTFVASLELARQGEVNLAQEQASRRCGFKKGASTAPLAEQSTQQV